MKNIVLHLFTLLLIVIFVNKLEAQNQYWVKLDSGSGFTLPEQDALDINNSINLLLEEFPEEIKPNFKVFTADFYYPQRSYNGGYPEVFEDLVLEAESQSTYFLLIANGIVQGTNESGWFIDFKLPLDDEFVCFDLQAKQELLNILKALASKFDSGSQLYEGSSSILEKFKYYIKVIVTCSCNAQQSECIKSSFERNDDYLLGQGFRKRKVTLGSQREWVNGTAGIYDHSVNKNSVIIDGQEYYIPEEVNENKVHLDNGNFIEEDDEFSVDFKGRVYIFDSNSFLGGSNEQAWLDAVEISSTEDYVEYWVILQDDISKNWYLYSRYTVGELEPIGSAIWDHESEDSRSVSPLSLLLKFTVNAVIDILIEAVANFIFDPSIKNWDDAFRSVNYTQVAADALYSLIPWENSPKKYEIIGRTLIGGVGRVLEKSKNNSSYSVQEGFEDFVVGAGTGALGAIVGQKILQFGSTKLFPGLMKIVEGASSNKIKSIFARCFSTNLMTYGCFTSATGVYVAEDVQKSISGLELHDIVVSKNERQDIAEAHTQKYNCDLLLQTETKSGWNSIKFQSTDDKHRCQLSLDDVALVQYGVQHVGDAVWLSIQDQGIEGVYVVTDVKRIKPPKIPSHNHSDGKHIYSYVTGIYEHTSNDVWKLTFESGDEIEATGSHPFYNAISNEWKPVAWLQPGDILTTKDGTDLLLSKEKLEGVHQVYNITVAGTHTYFVGDGGLWVHNSCGTIAALDALATKFLNNFSNATKKAEIDKWWALGFPKFFQRGTFFERLMAKSGRYSGWTITPHNWPVIDFQKIIGGKMKVVSMKTTITTEVSSWISTNADHLGKLNNMQVRWAQNAGNLLEIRALHIYVKDSELGNFSNWSATIKAKYPNIKEVIISSIETEFSL